MRVYPASSWRNKRFLNVLESLRREGHEVYNFREMNSAFRWEGVGVSRDHCAPLDYLGALMSDTAEAAFVNDRVGIEWCDVLVMLQPCGNSAHLEAGYAKGRGKRVYMLLSGEQRPELMYLLADACYADLTSLLESLACDELTMPRAGDA